MGFTQEYILGVNPPVRYGAQLLLSWSSDAPAGTYYQVYLDDALAWYGLATSAEIPAPTQTCRIDVGTVGPGEEATSFASSLPPLPLRTVTLSWLGGTFESADIAGFYVYGASTPGGAIDYATPLGDVDAYTAGIVTDGFGCGGFGQGGFGEAAGSYSWTSGALYSGVWTFAVCPYDSFGNVGPAAYASQPIEVPPEEPPAFAGGGRLAYSYSSGTQVAVLTWNASTF